MYGLYKKAKNHYLELIGGVGNETKTNLPIFIEILNDNTLIECIYYRRNINNTVRLKFNKGEKYKLTDYAENNTSLYMSIFDEKTNRYETLYFLMNKEYLQEAIDNNHVLKIPGEWGFGIEHETEMYRVLAVSEYAVADKYINDENAKHHHQLFGFNYKTSRIYEPYFYDQYNTHIKNWIINNINIIPVNVNMKQIFEMIWSIYDDNPENANIQKFMEYKNNILSDVSNYIGTDCSHTSKYYHMLNNGDNCHIEFVTQKFMNVTILDAYDELKNAENALLETANHLQKCDSKNNSYFLSKYGAQPFLFHWINKKNKYSRDNTNGNCVSEGDKIGITYNKSGSYHINITLPRFLVDENNYQNDNTRHMFHLKYARALQLFTPLLIAFYGTPDFRAVYNSMIDDPNMRKLQFSNTSYRLLSSKSSMSPMPCTSDLFNLFPEERDVVRITNSWYDTSILWKTPDTRKSSGYHKSQFGYIGTEFRSDPDKKHSDIGFGFEYRILDDFDNKYIIEVLHMLIYIADLVKLIDDNIESIKTVKDAGINDIIQYIMYDSSTQSHTISPENNSLFHDRYFNEFVTEIVLNGGNPNELETIKIPHKIYDMYNALFFIIPGVIINNHTDTSNITKLNNTRINETDISIIIQQEQKQERIPFNKLLDYININLHNLCTNENIKCIFTDSMIAKDKATISKNKLNCVNKLARDEYTQVVNTMNPQFLV